MNKNGTSMKYDSEAFTKYYSQKFMNKKENSTSLRASESYFDEVRFLFISLQKNKDI